MEPSDGGSWHALPRAAIYPLLVPASRILDQKGKKPSDSLVFPALDRREILKSGAVVSALAVFSQLRLGKTKSHVEAATAGPS